MDDAGVAGDRDPDNGDVGINDPGPGGDGDVTTPKHQPLRPRGSTMWRI